MGMSRSKCARLRCAASPPSAWPAPSLSGYRKKKREVIVPWTMHPMVKLYQLFPGLVEWFMRRMAKPAK